MDKVRIYLKDRKLNQYCKRIKPTICEEGIFEGPSFFPPGKWECKIIQADTGFRGQVCGSGRVSVQFIALVFILLKANVNIMTMLV